MAFLSLCNLVFSQGKGVVSGTVTDKEMGGESLPFANVFVKGTSIGGTTDIDGKYSMNVPAGNQTIVFSFVGYETVEKAVVVKEGQTITVNQLLGANQGVQLEEVKISASVNREKESALLLEQKKAVAIETKIGKQELARKGVSDVATAVTKTTGVSKQEGSGSVFVRGLGDRYNVTTLNGLPLPSNNPSRKNIDLSIFSTDIVEYVGIDKTYAAKNYGDFGGANIDIASKVYKGKGFAEVKIGSGLNTIASGQSQFYGADGPGYLGFYKTYYPAFPLNNYNFTTSWDRQAGEAPVNSSISLKGGDSYSLSDNTKLSFFAVGSFDNDYDYKEGIARGNVNVSGVARKNLARQSYTYNTNTTVMGNIRLKHKKHEFKYNGLMVDNSSNSHDDYQGIYDAFDDAAEGGAVIQRQTFMRNRLFVHQLLGTHNLAENLKVEWGGAYNFNKNNVPNRRQSTVLPNDNDDPTGPKSFLLVSNDSDNHRFYSDIEEEEIAANASVTYKFAKNEEEEYKAKLKLGYSGRFKNVDFDATQFNFAITIRDVQQPIINDVYNLDSYFNQQNLNAGLFTIRTFRGGLGSSTDVLLPQTYNGNQNIHAAYGELQYTFSDKFTGVFGVRGEQIKQTIDYNTSINVGTNELDKFAFLPSLSLKYILNDKNNLKFAASKTYTLPQYKERAPFLFEDVVSTTLGNQHLYSSDNYNADIKWEFFPERDELISVGAFGKYIQNPINEVGINSASNDISFVNSGDWGYAVGGELEVKKTIFNKEKEGKDGTLNNKLSAGLNVAYMHHEQELNSEKVSIENPGVGVNFSKDRDGFAGASDILLNTDLSYFKDFNNGMNLQTTLVYSYFSDRILALGVGPLGDKVKGNLVEKGYGTLDFVMKSKINKRISLGFSIKNLLNPDIVTFQDIQDVTVLSFRRGVDFKVSLSYNF
ncbi:Outer membrane receptor proteins, mostly Fe transport [Tenacibaculum sp. MAR_2009_124]|uniref:TonB-dependent receptor n=1 Tax=Tenacibaculum sp. MAR_2009_124 TaxID=1250059 RepID=UPI000897CE83|nr:TonB-dependent receptor [Tenacibaculum sp. MAR_2009_124]SEB95968.1 Outer membrane receptor proteins, mostly Fe transport [Tenacibaculum sp. MAR_2009_124]